MTTTQVAQVVSSIGLPFAYYEFPDDTQREPPFVAFMFTDGDDMYADDSNYQDIRRLVIELYTAEKDFTWENTVRGVLNTNNMPFQMGSAYLDDEHVYITTFTTEVVITNGE